MRIAALTQGLHIPSSRFRIRQLIQPMSRHGVVFEELHSQSGAYPPAEFLNRFSWIFEACSDSYRRAIASKAYDACIIQRELISTIPSFEYLLKKPLVADIDDAIWLYRKGWAAANLARHASHIVVGNPYLAEYFKTPTRPISIIPTGVDTRRFRPIVRSPTRSYGLIGWSGTSGGYEYFKPLQVAIGMLLRRHTNWRIRFISDQMPQFADIPPEQLEYFPWSPENEAQLTADMDIGLMPLDDSLWSLGKCSYKMLLYMACGIAVVATDIGMNYDILRMGEVGLGVRTFDEWQAALEALMENAALRQRLGCNGRRLVEQRFSLDVVASQWLDVLSIFK